MSVELPSGLVAVWTPEGREVVAEWDADGPPNGRSVTWEELVRLVDASPRRVRLVVRRTRPGEWYSRQAGGLVGP